MNRLAFNVWLLTGCLGLSRLDGSAAATITGLGTQKIVSAAAGVQWRDANVAKTYDPDGDDIFGSAGYVLFKTNANPHASAADDRTQMELSLPPWVAFSPSTTTDFGQINYGYTPFQNPTEPTASITTGMDGYTYTLNTGVTYPLFTIAVGSGVPASFTLTVATNNIYASAPSSITLRQTSGSGTGSATLTSFPISGYSDANFTSFKITGALPGDVFTLEGVSSSGDTGGSGTMYIQGLMFDAGSGTAKPIPVSAVVLPSHAMTFQSSPLGPLGFIDGMVQRTTAPYDKYVRTDVGGAYRWDGSAWRSITDLLAMQSDTAGVLSLALDAQQPNVLYLAAASTLSKSGVYKSLNGGQTWTFTGPGVFVDANAKYRNVGERLAVDPNNSSIVFFGSQKDGLYQSSNGGGTWSKVTAVPSGISGLGISFVVFDPSRGSSGSSPNIYVGVLGGGVYRTTDGGTSWAALTGQPPPASYLPNRAVVRPDGSVFVTYTCDNSGTGADWAVPTNGGVYQFIKGIGTPMPLGGGGQLPAAAGFSALAVDPKNANHLIVGTFQFNNGNRLYVTTDGGCSWAQLATAYGTKLFSWWGDYWFSTGFAGLMIDADPSASPRTWVTDGSSAWTTSVDTMTDTNTTWTSNASGIEELVIQDVRKIPGGPLLVGAEDVNGFDKSSLLAFPTDRWYSTSKRLSFGNGTSIDFEESSPENVVRVGGPGYKQQGWGSYSSDRGKTWTSFGSVPGGKAAGVVAASATNSQSLVWLPASGSDNQTTCYYSTDRGSTWTQSSGAPVFNYINDFYSEQQPLAADRVNGMTFYLYGGHGTVSGSFYRSTDGGKTFRQSNTSSLLPNAWRHCLKAVPGKESQLWISFENAPAGSGIWRSLDGGTTWAQVPGVTEAVSFGFGAPSPTTSQPILFLYGTIGGVRGLYRCDNAVNLTQRELGSGTWQLLSSPANPVPPPCLHALDGDRDNAGVVYLGTGGRGVIYGTP